MKILFFHPADYLQIGIPQGIATLSALLKREGHKVELFDTTFIKPKTYIPWHGNSGTVVYKETPYTLEDLVANDPMLNIKEEFQNKINSFMPDLIAVSTMTTNYDFAIDIIKNLKMTCPIVFGGVHATLCPDDVISNKAVNIICVGEGEEAIVELCNALEKGNDYSNIKNIWVKFKDGTIKKNDTGKFSDLNSLPCPDWSIFDERHLFRPYMGEV